LAHWGAVAPKTNKQNSTYFDVKEKRYNVCNYDMADFLLVSNSNTVQ